MRRLRVSKLEGYAALAAFGLLGALALGLPELAAVAAPLALLAGLGLALARELTRLGGVRGQDRGKGEQLVAERARRRGVEDHGPARGAGRVGAREHRLLRHLVPQQHDPGGVGAAGTSAPPLAGPSRIAGREQPLERPPSTSPASPTCACAGPTCRRRWPACRPVRP